MLIGKRSTSKLGLLAVGVAMVLSLASQTSAGPTAEEYAASVSGRIVPPGQLKIDGQHLRCGQRPTVIDDQLDDYGAAYPGFLILNSKLMTRVPAVVKRWIYAHECGHQFRGPDEETADCFPVQRGLR